MKTEFQPLTITRRFAIASALLLLSILNPQLSTAFAQLVADGATNTLSNVTTNITGDVTVGTNGSFTLLVLSDNALLTNSVNGLIGHNATAKSNEVRLINSTARWRMGGSLFVGSNGAASRLVVSNGALVENNNCFLGRGIESSNNFALITGGGSLWSNRNGLTIGNSGRDNRMIVTNGGWVVSQNGDVGGNATASNNLALVTRNGSVWSNTSNLRVGALSPGNRLVIEGGGLVHSAGATVGQSGSASNNEALVTGPGSIWTNNGSLLIGSQIGFNRLVVSNEAAVRSASASMGGLAAAVSNQVVVTGAGSVWSNQTTLILGGNSAGNRADVSEGGWLACNDGWVGSGFSANSNTVTLSGSGSGWNNLGGLIVGDGGSGNVLIASNGATVLSSNATIGASTSLGNNNFALLTGGGTLWSNRNNFTVGNYSFGNRLVVSNGAALFTGGNGVLGVNSGANTNSATVTGPGTRWLVASNLYVGSNGAFNLLLVTNGGTVSGANVLIGGTASSTNNRVVVDGGTLRATNASGTGVLDVRRNTTVLNAGLIDVDKLVRTNRDVVFIPRVFGKSGSIILHDEGVASPFPSTNTVAGLAGVITKVTVTLSNLTFSSPSLLNIQLRSPAGQDVMLMSDAGGVAVSNVVLTFDDSAATLLPQSGQIVTGTYRPTDHPPAGPYSTNLSSFNGSDPNGDWKLYITGDCMFGCGDSGTLVGWSLQITTDGDFVFVDRGAFAFNGGTLITRGALIDTVQPFVVGGVGGLPAIWDVRGGAGDHFVSGDLIVGSNSSFNQLLITNSALLTNSLAGTIGFNAGANSNLALLSGVGSTWSLGSDLYVGVSGAGNQLVVSNGAHVIVNRGVIGDDDVGTDNTVLVTGAGSLWSNANTLLIGNQGAGSRLVIGDGGTVFAHVSVIIGSLSSSTNNRIVVDGGTLLVTSGGSEAYLSPRRGTNVLNAGLVEVDQLLLGFASGIFEFNGGTLKSGRTICDNGRVFTVGNGVSAATFQLSGGLHSFTTGLSIANNATLTGSGTNVGTMAVSAGGTVSPGDGIGTLVFSNTPSLNGTILMEVFKIGGTRFFDQIRVDGTLFYGGALTVNNVGVTAFVAGDSFKLFDAAAYGSSFASLTLPPLNAGLGWTNKLTVDGSIEVVVASSPSFGAISRSGTNLIFTGTDGTPNAPYAVLTATNVALPLSNWVSIATNQFDSSGNFSFTNAISLGIPQRFYRIRTP